MSEAILRISGRRTATEEAIMPVPGSAVAHIVALTALALTGQSFGFNIGCEKGT